MRVSAPFELEVTVVSSPFENFEAGGYHAACSNFLGRAGFVRLRTFLRGGVVSWASNF